VRLKGPLYAWWGTGVRPARITLPVSHQPRRAPAGMPDIAESASASITSSGQSIQHYARFIQCQHPPRADDHRVSA
jgi:hypothetical protein